MTLRVLNEAVADGRALVKRGNKMPTKASNPIRIKAIYLNEVAVTDPQSSGMVMVEIWKDPISGGLFGVDASYLEQVTREIPSPFDKGHIFLL